MFVKMHLELLKKSPTFLWKKPSWILHTCFLYNKWSKRQTARRKKSDKRVKETEKRGRQTDCRYILKYKQECERTKVTECWVNWLKKNEWVWWEWLNLIKKEWIWWKLGNLMKMNESDEYQWIWWKWKNRIEMDESEEMSEPYEMNKCDENEWIWWV